MKILIATDGSKCSSAAVRQVASERWPEGTKVRLVFALELFPRELPASRTTLADSYLELERTERARADNFLGDERFVLTRGGFRDDDLSSTVILGPPKRVVPEEAERWGADLLVVGSHGDGLLKRLLLGSVSHAVALHSPCSVRIVKPVAA